MQKWNAIFTRSALLPFCCYNIAKAQNFHSKYSFPKFAQISGVFYQSTRKSQLTRRSHYTPLFCKVVVLQKFKYIFHARLVYVCALINTITSRDTKRTHMHIYTTVIKAWTQQTRTHAFALTPVAGKHLSQTNWKTMQRCSRMQAISHTV